MFKNALIYRITHWDQTALQEAQNKLDRAQFTECGATQAESFGWVAPRGDKHQALLEYVGGQLILRWCLERKAVPASAIKQTLQTQLDKIEKETGRRPKGKAAKEVKEEIVQTLLPRAFPKRSSTLVWIDPKASLVVLNTSSLKTADRLTTLLIETLGGGLALQALQTQTSPAVAMAEWLSQKSSPGGFSVDRECELKQPDSEKSSVRYARHTLDIDEVAAHITQGKMPTQVAMTWLDRVSFVLTEGLAIKKIKLLDVVLDNRQNHADDEGFDADIALCTGELSGLIPDLIAALGDELALGAAQVLSCPCPSDTSRTTFKPNFSKIRAQTDYFHSG